MTVLNLMADTYFSDTHWDNVDLYIRDSIEDLSKNSRSLSVLPTSGNVSKQGDSLYFSQQGYLQVSAVPIYLASETFTIDFWFKVPDNTETHYAIIDFGDTTNSMSIRIYSSNDHTIAASYIAVMQGLEYENVTCTFTKNQWHHVAIVKESVVNTGLGVLENKYTTYLNGINIGSNYYSGEDIYIGGIIGRVIEITTTFYFNYGKLKHFRVTRGVARFTENFDPLSLFDVQPLSKLYYGATEVQKLYKGSEQLYPPFDPNSNGDPLWNNVILYLKGDDFTDSSPTPKTITTATASAINTTIKKYGTGSFDFRNQSSNISNTTFNFSGVSQFTLEFWAYFTSVFNYSGLFQFGGLTTNDYFGKSMDIHSSGIRRFQTVGTYYPVTLALNTWHHLAFTKDENSHVLYLNGINTMAYTSSHPPSIVGIAIGAYYGQSYQMKGYMDSFRITNAVRYTANFNPETDTYLAY